MNNISKIILGVFFTFIILMLSGVLGMKITSMFDYFPAGFFNQFVIFVFSSVLIYYFNKKGIINFNINKIIFKKIITPVLVIFVFLTIVELTFIGLFESVNSDKTIFPAVSILETFFIFILLSSLSEELLFRGFLQNILEPIKPFGITVLKVKLSLPVLISGVFFGLIHFSIITLGASFNFALKIVFSAIIIGIIAGYFQEKYNNFLIAFIVHVTANLSGVLLSTMLY